MKKLTISLVASGLAALVVLGGATAANATVAYPEGGTWDYGVKWGGGGTDFVKSDYHHMTRTHKSTACSTGACSYSGWTVPARWALASTVASTWGNASYYDVQ
ncbi:lactococcin 972 family bacteriocin [Leifsonia sp. F6_8S_P_1B]|uniref:Lactococcin 972 family bacteriocin n=1 Tax=Leifsonia williamsii TaxID=3035919 RepID=A0ABT8K677_9MICO|nr:lactococcin 972 family bacteriocin [Leifsonia williamsii]MDN4612968.1 lactococcin 972 family bacteriocin [Leifsonia williamsii]